MKNNKMIVLIVLLTISIIINVVLVLLLVCNNQLADNLNNDIKPNYYGLYQTTYYNNFNVQMIFTIKLNEDGNCQYGDYAASYSGELINDCKYTVDGKNVVLNLYNKSDETHKKEGQILDSGVLFINNKQLHKIN